MTTHMRAQRRPQRLRLAPFKILSLLLYGEYSWLQPEAGGLLHVQLSEMARDMRISRDRIRDHLMWLAEHNYVREVEFTHGRATIRLEVPPVLDNVLGAEREEFLKLVQQKQAVLQVLGGDK